MKPLHEMRRDDALASAALEDAVNQIRVAEPPYPYTLFITTKKQPAVGIRNASQPAVAEQPSATVYFYRVVPEKNHEFLAELGFSGMDPEVVRVAAVACLFRIAAECVPRKERKGQDLAVEKLAPPAVAACQATLDRLKAALVAAPVEPAAPAAP